MKRIVRGNDFTMRIPVVKIVEGEKVAFPLPGCTDIVVRLCSAHRRLELAHTIDAKEDNVIVARVEGDRIPLGTYALEVRGKIFGNDWRSNEYEQVAIVDRNADADTELDNTDEGEDSVEMDTAVVVLPPDRELDALVKEALAQNKAMSELSDAIKASEEGRTKSEELRAKSEEARVQAELTRANNEAERVQAEQVRESAENARADAENARVAAESTRVTAENARADAENERVTAERERVTVESTRVTAENKRAQSEQRRESAETERVSAEKARVTAETARAAAEAQRADAESQRENAFTSAKGACETATKNAISATDKANVAADKANDATAEATSAEAERKDAEDARVTAENARVAAENERVTAENARASAEAERKDAEDARKEAEQMRETAFGLSKSAAETAISNANAATEKANTEAEKAKAVVEDYKQNAHEHLTIILTTDDGNDVVLKGAVVSIKYQNSNMETAAVGTLTWEGDPLKTDITAGMIYTVSTSKVSGYDYVRRLENVTAIGGYNRSVTLRYANAMDKEKTGQIYINPTSGSATLHRKNVDALNASLAEYRSKGFPCVMDAQGHRMAKIKSATFEGNYGSGMTEGTVTFMDGTICDINTLNEKGCNWMVYRPELFFSSWVNETGDEILSFGGNMNVTGGHSFREKYVGMFKAFNQNGVLKSQPNRIPTGNQTIANFQVQAEAGGKGYGLWNYSDWCKENALHISLFGNTNQETNIGVGRIDNYANVRNIVTGFTLPLVGTEHNYGTRATVDSAGIAVNCLNFLDMEGLGEQMWEFVIGYRHDEGTVYLWDDNSWSETHDADRTLPYAISSANREYIKFITGGEYFDMTPRTIRASSTTGWCDGYWSNTNGRLLFVGGSAYTGSICGLSASSSNRGFEAADGVLGARLAFYSTPVTVSGAELVASLG